jgi:hypothetical protein
VLCEAGAPEADRLVALGLAEGSPNHHPGQGTACRRFFFANAYLELVFLTDAAEAQAEPARSTRLYERWARRGSGASPFGVVLRPGPDPSEGAAKPPFPSWSYRPKYLPPGFAIEVAAGTPLEEPEVFYIPFARRPDTALDPEPLTHGIALAEMTAVGIGVPGRGARSAGARAAEASGGVAFAPANEHLMTLTFDAESRGRMADLRPELPLVLRW